jgi:hypothetical protein
MNPTGRLKAGPFWLQGNGDGFLSPFLSAAKSVDKLGLQGMVGAKFVLDDDANTSWFNYSLHVDYEVLPNFFPLVELNGFIPINDATTTPFAFEGLDLGSASEDLNRVRWLPSPPEAGTRLWII